MKVEIGTGEDLKDGQLEITVTMRGTVDQVISGLVRGFPPEALEELATAIQLEARKKLGGQLVDATLDQDPLTAHGRQVRQLIDQAAGGRLSLAEEVRDDQAADAAREQR